ncbi:MAG: replication restart helicase PriA, partial [Armatimonadota bacterium]
MDIIFRRAPAFVKLVDADVVLTDDQRAAVEAITSALQSPDGTRALGKAFLLYGVTASGKTEVYLRCIERALNLGRASLVLLPEIALTTQVMNIFRSRLGDEVAVMHSGLSPGERCDEWVRIERGEARVVLGARSAVFAPLQNLGLVIVDEEHDSSYKQDAPPRYNARDVAIHRSIESGAALVLGSATPSVETFYRAQQGEFRLLEMPSRVENRPMPSVRVVDLREATSRGRSTIFSEELEAAVREHLARKRQVMLLQNRRAYSILLLCRECGFVPYCPNCAVSLRFHAAERKLSCHHCEHQEPAPSVCPKCGGLKIRRFGIGTERVEEETRRLFPEARVLRMDRDTTTRRGAHASILNQFRRAD